MAVSPINILSLDRKALEDFFQSIGEKSFRAKQLLQWIYQRGITDFDDMTDMSKTLRRQLSAISYFSVPEIVQTNFSADGTVKFLLKLQDGNCIETVYIPESDRGTLCVSSQVGCGLNCTFCATARQGYNRNLSVDEIIAQVWLVNNFLENRDDVDEILFRRYENDERRPVTNVVMMGMGEPLLNFDNVVSAMKLMMDDFCFGLSRRRVTLSTAGLVPMIDRLKMECPVSLAVSLHAPNNTLRSKLVPLNKKYPIEELLDSCLRFVNDTNRQRVTFEYVMLKDINDSQEHAKELAQILKNIPSKINLIPFNSFLGSQFQTSDEVVIDNFRNYLQSKDIFTVTRKTRGDDINAACGQLAGNFHDRTSRSKKMNQDRLVFS